ncbi:MAG TPA: DeoR/GlpR family DNA-binding transcription regulator [Pirellulaceae bacterium]|nr:DeoR/GlpR family DNA-binding transcription regulator [Pirellulaceae bacterium]HMO91431.1 DeoR/GlpR family DNA-binding transcription regulator [Pirellulaceae bacterium]HMP69492.1 DeoR/GlpR family DNA-binding transcription regulator [Pirellulaceae bacterium]
MTIANRREKLIEIIREQGFSTLPQLCETLQVSESTVRRDLNLLEADGAAKRTHGGVVYTGGFPKLPHFDLRHEQNLSRKKAIAQAAAQLLKPGNTVLLDGGSTSYELARLLVDQPMQVITNSLPVANLFVRSNAAELIFVGGVIQSKTGVAVGPHAANMLSGIRCQHAFISAAGINFEGVFNNNLLLVEIEQAMIECADTATLIADSSKFGQTSIGLVCSLNRLHRAIVDTAIEKQWIRTLQDCGVEVVTTKES